MSHESKFVITPDTRLKALLDHFPNLEDTLIEMSPAFAKLRNPVLRRTVARVATLQQVAKVGNIPLSKLINTLREQVGQESGAFQESEREKAEKPEWLKPDKIEKTLDARPILEAGGHPINQVIQDATALKAGHIYELITPFLPAPLIDRAKSMGLSTWTDQVEAELFKTYFLKK